LQIAPVGLSFAVGAQSLVVRSRLKDNIDESGISLCRFGTVLVSNLGVEPLCALAERFEGSNFISAHQGGCWESFGKAPTKGLNEPFLCGENSLKDTDREKSYNIFNHQLVPKHELLSKSEAEELMKEFHIRPHQLPYVMTSDPAVEALGGKMGDIIRVTRKSATAGEVVVYRYVVEG